MRVKTLILLIILWLALVVWNQEAMTLCSSDRNPPAGCWDDEIWRVDEKG